MTYLPASIALSVPSVSATTTWFEERFGSDLVDHREGLTVVRLGSTQLVLLEGPADPHWRTKPVLVEAAPRDCPLASCDDVEVQEGAKTQLGARWATLTMPGRTYKLVLVTPVPPLSAEQLEQVREVLRPLKEKVARWHEAVQAESVRLLALLDVELRRLETERNAATGGERENLEEELSKKQKERRKARYDLKAVWNTELDRLLEHNGPHRIKWIAAGINPGGTEASEGRYLHPAGPSGGPMHALLRHDVPSWDYVLVLNQTSLSSANADELKNLSLRQQEILTESSSEMANAICQLAEITRAHVWILGNKELYGRLRSISLFYPFFQRLAEFYNDHPALKERLYLSNHPARGNLFTELPMTDENLDQGLEVALRASSSLHRR